MENEVYIHKYLAPMQEHLKTLRADLVQHNHYYRL